jgi:hypothetical protein
MLEVVMNKKLFQLCLLVLPSLLIVSSPVAAKTDCAGECHIIKPYEQGVKNKNLLSSKHIQAGLECTDCHEQTAETRKMEAEAYAKGEYDDPMYTREFGNDFCLRCHEDYESLAEKTKNLEELWGINPHKSHLDPDCNQCHKSHQPSTVVCSECHTADWEKRLPEGWELKN